MRIRHFLYAAPLAAVLVGGIAAPAFASSNPQPVTVNATVQSSVTISGLTNSITFPAGAAGATETVTNAEQYSVSTNNAAGYTLSIAPGASSLSDAASATIPNSALTLKETGAGGDGFAHAGETFGSSPMVIDNTASAGTTSYVENWSFTSPATAVPGNYSETFTYLATAN